MPNWKVAIRSYGKLGMVKITNKDGTKNVSNWKKLNMRKLPIKLSNYLIIN